MLDTIAALIIGIPLGVLSSLLMFAVLDYLVERWEGPYYPRCSTNPREHSAYWYDQRTQQAYIGPHVVTNHRRKHNA